MNLHISTAVVICFFGLTTSLSVLADIVEPVKETRELMGRCRIYDSKGETSASGKDIYIFKDKTNVGDELGAIEIRRWTSEGIPPEEHHFKSFSSSSASTFFRAGFGQGVPHFVVRSGGFTASVVETKTGDWYVIVDSSGKGNCKDRKVSMLWHQLAVNTP